MTDLCGRPGEAHICSAAGRIDTPKETLDCFAWEQRHVQHENCCSVVEWWFVWVHSRVLVAVVSDACRWLSAQLEIQTSILLVVRVADACEVLQLLNETRREKTETQATFPSLPVQVCRVSSLIRSQIVLLVVTFEHRSFSMIQKIPVSGEIPLWLWAPEIFRISIAVFLLPLILLQWLFSTKEHLENCFSERTKVGQCRKTTTALKFQRIRVWKFDARCWNWWRLALSSRNILITGALVARIFTDIQLLKVHNTSK